MTALQQIPKRSSIRLKPAQDQQLKKSAAHQTDDPQSVNLNSGTHLSPAALIHLQRTVGNHAVQRMLKQHHPSTIQRDPKDDVISVGDNLSGQTSNISDMVGNEKGFDKATGGGAVGVVGSLGGMGVGAFKVGVNATKLSKVNTELEQATLLAQSEEGLHATITLLERKKVAAQKGIAEGSGSILGGISGFIGSVSGLISGTTAQLLSKVMGPVGAGFGIILGTIAAIRDFMNVHKRRKAKEAIGVVINGYSQIADELQGEMQAKSQEIESTLASVTPENASETSTKLNTLSTEFAGLESKFDGVDKMRMALAVAQRKQGSKGKIMSGVTNLLGVAGGGALLALGLGALGVAGVGAAAGPVGWALVGIAAVAALSYFIGMKIKQSIRASNITRMNQEIALVDEFINTGKVNGAEVAGGLSKTPEQRKAVIWQRSMFPTAEQKGWFNKLISKSKSGKMTIGERKQELTDYLVKYDKASASNTVWEGFKKALAPGEEGDMMVDNPQYDAQKAPSLPQKITLRDQITGLIEFNFPGKSAEFIKSINAGGTKEQGAKSLLMQKMKLEDK